MLLSKGETTNEIAQGLKCLADAIRVVHKTFLRMLTTVPFRDGLYDATALGIPERVAGAVEAADEDTNI